LESVASEWSPRLSTDGWSTTNGTGWLSKSPRDGKSLATFLAEVGEIPVEEAQRIATESVEEWRRRYVPSPPPDRRKTFVIVGSTLGLIFIGAAALIVGVTVLLVKLL
jgi:hypothetical protein